MSLNGTGNKALNRNSFVENFVMFEREKARKKCIKIYVYAISL